MRKGPCGLQKFFGEKICVYVATLLAIFFWSHHIYHLNGSLVIASNEIIFGGDFEKILEIYVVQWKSYFNKKNPHFYKIFFLEKETINLKRRLNKSEYTKYKEN
jgi:hypothetical protein